MEAPAVQAFLQAMFTQWGLPRALRLDNGIPWASSNLVPAPLSLWIASLGIQVIFNPPHHPQANAIIERDHATLQRWAELRACSDLATAQQHLDQAILRQRTAYPYLSFPSRQHAFPALVSPLQAYTRELEPQLCQSQHLLTYLASLHLLRRVDSQGRISLFDHNYSVGRAYAHLTVHVQLDPQACAWTVRNDAGQTLKVLPVSDLACLALPSLAPPDLSSCLSP